MVLLAIFILAQLYGWGILGWGASQISKALRRLRPKLKSKLSDWSYYWFGAPSPRPKLSLQEENELWHQEFATWMVILFIILIACSK